MNQPIQFDAAKSLKVRFRAALPDVNEPVIEVPVAVDNKPMTIGQTLYLSYRIQRLRQNFEEFKWESLDLGQRLVWERLALICQEAGLKLN